MQGTVDGFSYGVFTPIAAFVMACLGSALGLRCVTRSLRAAQSFKPGWLSLGAASIGCGIWTMHFIAMMGFRVRETPISHDVPLTVASLAVAVLVVGAGVFVVGYLGSAPAVLITAGVITGLGVAAMHYLGMAGLSLEGQLHYDTTIVTISVVIAVVAATAALWAAVSVRGFFPSLLASLIMGVAVTAMHYTGMAAISVHLMRRRAPHGGLRRRAALDHVPDAAGAGRLSRAGRCGRHVRPAPCPRGRRVERNPRQEARDEPAGADRCAGRARCRAYDARSADLDGRGRHGEP